MFQKNSIETCILSRVKLITSSGWMHETSTQTWCTGKTQRDRVEREVGGGIGMGNTCKPMAVSFQCMTKSTTIKKKKKKNFPQFAVIHTIKGFSIINEAEVFFLEFPCLCDTTDVSELTSGSSCLLSIQLYIWKFSVHLLLKPRLEDFEHYLGSM